VVRAAHVAALAGHRKNPEVRARVAAARSRSFDEWGYAR